MAGIGFELRKLFRDNSLRNFLRAYGYSSVVTLGSFFLILILILVMQLLMLDQKVLYQSRQLFVATVAYCFVFSLIVGSGFIALITRFLADRLYAKDYDDIVPSLYGVLSILLPVGSLIAIIFFWHSPLPPTYIFMTYVLFLELLILRVLEVYITALKDFKRITISYLVGTVVAIILAVVFTSIFKSQVLPYFLLAMDIGIFIIIIGLLTRIKSFFKNSSNRYFLFMTYFNEFKIIFLSGLFYHAGLYIHNIIIWNSDWGVSVAGTYLFSPIYDVVMFYAFLSILPTMTFFVVFTEISFYEKARIYFAYITKGGCLSQIEMSRKEMLTVLWQELSRMVEIQFIITLLFFVIGGYQLPKIGLDFAALELYYIMLFGAFCTVIFLIITIFMLYFDDRRGAVTVNFIFFMMSALFTWITLQYGDKYFGFGFFMAALIALIFGLIRLSLFLKKIDYYVFCSQPMFVDTKYGYFSRFLLKRYDWGMYKKYSKTEEGEWQEGAQK